MVGIKVNSESRAAHTCFSIATKCQVLAHQASEEWQIRHHSITGIIFVAFSIEAMINHYGKVMFGDKWESERKCRKQQHKTLFEAVNLSNYLGSTTYQVANQCFKIRDTFAHGKTKDETLELNVSDDIPYEEKVSEVMSAPTSMESWATIENLDKYIEIVYKIQEDIQEHGYSPDQDHIPEEERTKLYESPLNMTGVREFVQRYSKE
ncbi:MAG: hypothetical protein QNJ53_03360 [Pleurocapsa sp. MO_192.B19]|nr:hypothetical protein [Pleurocapsa sp. MO_192.B19]